MLKKFIIPVVAVCFMFATGCGEQSAPFIKASYNKNNTKINEEISENKKLVYKADASYPIDLSNNKCIQKTIIKGTKYYIIPILGINNKSEKIRIECSKTSIVYAEITKPTFTAAYQSQKLQTNNVDKAAGYKYTLNLPKKYKDKNIIQESNTQNNDSNGTDDSFLFFMPFLLSNSSMIESTNTGTNITSKEDKNTNKDEEENLNPAPSNGSKSSSISVENEDEGESNINENEGENETNSNVEENNNSESSTEENSSESTSHETEAEPETEVEPEVSTPCEVK